MRTKREALQMKINDNCGACGQCFDTCPYDAIDIVKTKGYSNFVIDQKNQEIPQLDIFTVEIKKITIKCLVVHLRFV